jgi:hypothetical protein
MQPTIDSDRCNGCPAKRCCTALGPESKKRVTIVLEGENKLFGLDGHIQEIYSLSRKYNTKIISMETTAPQPTGGWNPNGYPGQQPCPALRDSAKGEG